MAPKLDTAQFLATAKRVARHVPFAKQALAMYFAMLDGKTPMWVKATVAGALAYFVMPIDAIADVLPLIGFTDDAAIIFAAYKTVSNHVTEEHELQAVDWLESNT